MQNDNVFDEMPQDVELTIKKTKDGKWLAGLSDMPRFKRDSPIEAIKDAIYRYNRIWEGVDNAIAKKGN